MKGTKIRTCSVVLGCLHAVLTWYQRRAKSATHNEVAKAKPAGSTTLVQFCNGDRCTFGGRPTGYTLRDRNKHSQDWRSTLHEWWSFVECWLNFWRWSQVISTKRRTETMQRRSALARKARTMICHDWRRDSWHRWRFLRGDPCTERDRRTRGNRKHRPRSTRFGEGPRSRLIPVARKVVSLGHRVADRWQCSFTGRHGGSWSYRCGNQ